jgi:hypothetical protein
VRRALVIVVAAAAACTVGGSDTPKRSPVVCDVRFAAPSGFAPLEPFEEEYADHVGVRLGFRDDRRRELHVFAGIPGEFGEGLPAAGEVPLTEGRTGLLAGREEIWVVTWEEGDLCDPRSVLANGFARPAFLDALGEMGLAPGD